MSQTYPAPLPTTQEQHGTNPVRYWAMICAGLDMITPVPIERWDNEQYYDPDPSAPGKMPLVPICRAEATAISDRDVPFLGGCSSKRRFGQWNPFCSKRAGFQDSCFNGRRARRALTPLILRCPLGMNHRGQSKQRLFVPLCRGSIYFRKCASDNCRIRDESEVSPTGPQDQNATTCQRCRKVSKGASPCKN